MARQYSHSEAIWAYTISKEKILKRLVDGSVFTQKEADDLLSWLYRKLELALNPQSEFSRIEMRQMPTIEVERTIVSLTDIARAKSKKNPGYLIQSWLRSDCTVELLRAWELKYNKEFDNSACDLLLEELHQTGTTLTPKLWRERTRAKGIFSTQGKGGGTYADPDIALAFRAWIQPELMIEMIARFQYCEQIMENTED